jgi:hypothetical protein
MQKSLKDLLAGLVFIAFGLAFAYAASTYPLGTAIRMGPGYFPLVLGGLLALLGIIVVIEGVIAGEGEALGSVPWRGAILILGAVVFFGFTVRGLGLAPSIFVTVLLAAFASRRTGILAALAISVGLTALCLLVFVTALGLPLPLFGPWVPF